MGSALEFPEEVKTAGIQYWKGHLIGFFLDGNLSYSAVLTHLQRNWKLKGNMKVKSDSRNFYFEFSCHEDKLRILKSDPMFIRGKMFIISSW